MRRSIVSLMIITAAAVLPCKARGGAVPVPADIPDVERFMQIGAATRPWLSPDGETLLFTSAMTGTTQLYQLLESGWPYQLTFFPNGLAGYNVDPGGRTIAATASVGGTERNQIYLIDVATGQTSRITTEDEVRFGLPVFSPDGRRIYFGANLENPKDVFVYEQDLGTGRRRIVYDQQGMNGVMDMAADGRHLLVWHANSSSDTDLFLVDLAGTIVPLTLDTKESQYSAALFTRDAARIVAITDEGTDGTLRLAVIETGAGGAPRLRFLFPRERSPWSVEGMSISPDHRYLAWTSNEDGYGRLHLYDLDEARSLPVPELDGIVSLPALASGGRVAFAYSSPLRTTDIWTWDPRGGDRWGRAGAGAGTDAPRQRTFSTYAGIDPDWFTPPELIRYRSFDGKEIPAFLYLPPGMGKDPVPFIIDVHGGPESQSRPFFNRHFQYLLLHGYGILMPNVRGSSGYGRDYAAADDYTRRMDSVRDLAWGVRYLLEHGLTRPGEVGVKGSSYGGYMTLAGMTEYPELFAAGIDEVGIANFETFFANTAEYRRELRSTEYGPTSDAAFLRSISPIHKVDRIQGALLVVHGENDPRVPVDEARQILRALVARRMPVDSLIFSDEGHGVSKLQNRLVLYRRMVEFFDQYLKGGASRGSGAMSGTSRTR
jgi:dipeptidyl aminopeptidase/acylaminoacyl peptidase